MNLFKEYNLHQYFKTKTKKKTKLEFPLYFNTICS